MSINNKKNRKRNKSNRRELRSALRRSLHVENLETRNLLATLIWEGDVNANWDAGTSEVTAGDGGDTNWEDNSSGLQVKPADGDTLVFSGAAPGTLNNDTTANNSYTLNFSAGGYTILGNAITLDNPGDDVINSSGSNFFRNTFNLAAGSTFDISDGNFFDEVGGLLTGTGDLTKTGSGTLGLGNAHNYSGSTNVNNGEINVFQKSPPSVQITSSQSVNVASNAVLRGVLNGGTVNAPIDAAVGSSIRSDAGNLFLGDATTTSGFRTAGTITVAAGQSLTLNDANAAVLGASTTLGGAGATLNAANGVSLSAGDVLQGTGTVNATIAVNSGTISPGTSVGDIDVTGDVTFADSSTYVVEIDGAASFDRLDITGAATLANANLDLSGAHTPALGESYDIITTTGGTTGVLERPSGNPLIGGDTFFLNNQPLEITYGNDVTLTYDITPIIDAGPGNNDINVILNGPNLELRIDGALVMDTPAASLTSITINGEAGDDALTVDHSNGLVDVPITFHGGANTDSLVITGTPGGGAFNNARETYIVGATEDAGTWELNPAGALGNGAADTNEMFINFTGLEPADTDSVAATFDVLLGAAGNQGTLSNGGDLNGADSLLFTDNNSTFETFRFANKSQVRIMGQGGDDAFRLNATTNATGLTDLEYYGHQAAGVVGPGDDNSSDTFTVNATLNLGGGNDTEIFGQGGSDLVHNADFPPFGGTRNLDSYAGALNVSFGENGGDEDLLYLQDVSSVTADNVTIQATTITGASPAPVTYMEAERVLFESSSADDTIDILSTASGTNYLVSGDGGGDTFTIGNQTADFFVNADGSLGSDGGSLDNILGDVFVVAQLIGVEGIDTLNVDDSGTNSLAAAADISTVGNFEFPRTPFSLVPIQGPATELTGFAPAVIRYAHDFTTFGSTSMDFVNVFTSTGPDTIAVNATTAIDTTRIDMHTGDDATTMTINGDGLSADNIFHGSAGTDNFVLNVTTNLGATSFTDLTSLEIHGDAPSANAARDRLEINDASGTARDLVFDYLDTPGDLDINPGAGGGLGAGVEDIPVNVRTMETVIYNGGGGDNDSVRVEGTSGDDDLTVALRNNDTEVLVFLDGNPYLESDPVSVVDFFPGMAAGGAGPDISLTGLDGNITLDGGGNTGTTGVGDRAIVYAASEDNLNTPGGAADPDYFGFGAGVLIPGFGAGDAFDEISVNESFFSEDQVDVFNNTFGDLVDVTIDAATFVQAGPAIPSQRPALIVNGGDEAVPQANGIADDFIADPSDLFNIQLNGNLPGLSLDGEGIPQGDQLLLFSPASINVFSDKASPPNVTTTFGNNIFGIRDSSIERVFMVPGNGVLNLIGDNNDPSVDQTDNYVVTGRDSDAFFSPFDFDDGFQEGVLEINGSSARFFDDVRDLNAYGFDLQDEPNLNNPNPNAVDTPATAATADDIDTLDITAYADDTPLGWGIDVLFAEGSPNQEDGDQSDLLIYNTSLHGGEVSEDIVVRPAGPENGELVVTNGSFGTPIVDIDYVGNTDIIVLDNDGFVNDTDTLTLLGTNPDTVQVSGNDSFEVDFDADQEVDSPLVTVRDANDGTILYRLRGFTDPADEEQHPIASVSFDMLAGNDSMNFETPFDTAFTSGVDQVQVQGGSGDDSVAIDYSFNEDPWHTGRLTYDGGEGSDSLSFVGVPDPAVNVNYTPGPLPGAGTMAVNHPTSGLPPQVVDFVNLEPVFDFSVGIDLTIHAGNAANQISYFTDNGVGTLDSLVGGSGYTEGVYVNVPLTGGTGTGARANITVDDTGTVTAVTLVNDGSGYTDNDALSANSTLLGGVGSVTNFSVQVASFSGTVSVDNQEVLVFSNKQNLIIHGDAGSDEISLNWQSGDANQTAPVGLATINVNADDPTAGSDTVVLNGTTGNDTVGFAPSGADAMTVTGLGPTINLTTTEHVNYNGQGGGDDLTVTTPAGLHEIQLERGIEDDTGTISIFSPRDERLLGLGFQNIDAELNAGSLTFADAGGRVDDLVYSGRNTTNSIDVFTVNAAGRIRVTESVAVQGAAFLDVFTPGIRNVTLVGQDGDDIFNLPSDHPFVRVLIDGSNPDSGSDVLNVQFAAGAQSATIAPSTNNPTDETIAFTGVTAGPIEVSGVELVAFTGTNNNDSLNVDLGAGVATARVQNGVVANTDLVSSDVLPNIHFSALNAFTLQGADDPTTATFVLNDLEGASSYTFDSDDANDTLVIEGDGGVDSITASLNAGNLRVAGAGNTIDTAGMNATDLLRVVTLGGADTLTVNVNATALINTPIEYDGGDGSDTLTVSGNPTDPNPDEVIYTVGAAVTEGHLRYENAANARLMSIDFSNLEPVNDLINATNLTINGTAEENDITYQQGANATLGRVTVDGFELIDFNNKTNLNLNGNNGNDTILLNNASLPTGLQTVVASGNDGDDTINVLALPDASGTTFVSATLNGNAGNDSLDASNLTVNTPLTLNGGQGADVLIGGRGNDTINGGGGEDTMIGGDPAITPDIGDNTYDGGTGFDTISILGTSASDTLDVNQTTAGTLTSTVNGNTASETFSNTEAARIDGELASDTIRLTIADALFDNAATPATTVLAYTVLGNENNTSDRLIVVDDGLGDTIIHRQSRVVDTGSIEIAPAHPNGAAPVIAYEGVERIDVTPVNNITGRTGTDGQGRLFIFKADPFEANDQLFSATFLGSGANINVDPTIDPGPGDLSGPGDQDWYRFVADSTGTLDVQIMFTSQGTLGNGRTGLPGNGNLDLNAFDVAGNLITGFGSNENTATDVDERIRIPVVAGQTYFVQVVAGATNPDAINIYNLTAINDAPPVPFDLELNDIIQVGTVSANAADTTTFTAASGTPGNPALNAPTVARDFVGKTVEFTTGANVGRRAVIANFVEPAGTFTLAPLGNLLLAPPVVGDTFIVETTDTGRSQLDDVTRDNTPVITFRLDDDILLLDSGGNVVNPNVAPDEQIPIPFNSEQVLTPTTAGYRVPVFIEGAPQQAGTAPQTPIGYARPLAGTPGVYVFDFGVDAVQAVAGVDQGLALTDGSHFISAKVEITDPAGNPNPTITDFGARSTSLEIVVDTVDPPVFFGDPDIDGDGLLPDSDSGVITMPMTIADRITNDTTPTFFGRAEANAIIRGFIDITDDGLTADDILIGQTVATPLDGTNQHPFGEWQFTSTVDMNDPRVLEALGTPGNPAPKDGLRTIIITAEDVAGNETPANLAPELDIFIDTSGPVITNVLKGDISNKHSNKQQVDQYEFGDDRKTLFDPKPEAGPDQLISSIIVQFSDLPNRIPHFPYDAVKQELAEEEGHYSLIGDANGNITIIDVQLVPNSNNNAGPGPATVEYEVIFHDAGPDGIIFTADDLGAPLPDDRFTFGVSDAISDVAGNHLDGESQGNSPFEGTNDPPPIPPIGEENFQNQTIVFPTGNGIPGGAFSARFNIDSRAEIGVWAAGSVWVDTNGNFRFDPQNEDFVNRDITYSLGFTADDYFAGNFSPAGANQTADGFDKIGAYGSIFPAGGNRFLIDWDNDGVADISVPNTFRGGPSGAPIAGNFDGNAANGDEVGLVTSNGSTVTIHLDTDHDYVLDTTRTLAGSVDGAGYPIVGDFNGDMVEDIATFVDNTFRVYLGTNAMNAAADFEFTPSFTFDFGFITSRDRPVAADMNGDAIDDIGLWVPDRAGTVPQEAGEWYFLLSGQPSYAVNPTLDGVPDTFSVLDRIRPSADDLPGTLVVEFDPIPFGRDIYAQYGDEFALPIVGNFDPPVLGSGASFTEFVTHTNENNRYDVDVNGLVQLQDVLTVVNYIHNHGEGILWNSAGADEPKVDTTFDGRVGLDDALAVVREMHRQEEASAAAAEGEGNTAALVVNPIAANDISVINTLPTSVTMADTPTPAREEIAPETDASLDEALVAIAWESAYNADESPELYTELAEDNEVVLEDDLLADIALANEE